MLLSKDFPVLHFPHLLIFQLPVPFQKFKFLEGVLYAESRDPEYLNGLSTFTPNTLKAFRPQYPRYASRNLCIKLQRINSYYHQPII